MQNGTAQLAAPINDLMDTHLRRIRRREDFILDITLGRNRGGLADPSMPEPTV